MADSHGEGHGGGNVTMYMVVFAALCVFTIISFIVNGAVRADPPALTKEAGFGLILGVAVCKAILVGMIFMHLKWDWGRLYFMIIPVMILGILLMAVLMPDIVLGWKEGNIIQETVTKSPH